MRTIKFIVAILTLSLTYQYAEAQNNCPGNKVRMYSGFKGCGCNNCQRICVDPADVPAYQANGWSLTGCSKFCCVGFFKYGDDASVTETSLTNIYPNPVYNSATIFFSLSQSQNVSFTLLDLTGRTVMTLKEEIFEEGENEFIWNTSSAPAGIYFMKMETESHSEVKRVTLIK
jgi:hypothetical protein